MFFLLSFLQISSSSTNRPCQMSINYPNFDLSSPEELVHFKSVFCFISFRSWVFLKNKKNTFRNYRIWWNYEATPKQISTRFWQTWKIDIEWVIERPTELPNRVKTIFNILPSSQSVCHPTEFLSIYWIIFLQILCHSISLFLSFSFSFTWFLSFQHFLYL
jgi:hypothetical protein